MNKSTIAMLAVAVFVGGCGKGGTGTEETVSGTSSQMVAPGFQETQKFCTQCHALPSPSQHHPEAWPGIVTRMEGRMIENNRPMPNQAEREAIIGYLQSGWQK